MLQNCEILQYFLLALVNTEIVFLYLSIALGSWEYMVGASTLDYQLFWGYLELKGNWKIF